MAPETLTKMTYEDLLRLPEDRLRHEIIDGKHYVNTSPSTQHQRVSMGLVLAIGHYIEENYLKDLPLGDLFFQMFHTPLVLSPFDVVEPDLLYVSNEHNEILKTSSIQGAPDLLVEILSDSNRAYDEVIKYALYERTGVGEYWIVDSTASTVCIFRSNEDGQYECTAELSRNDILTSPLFPNLKIRLSQVFP